MVAKCRNLEAHRKMKVRSIAVVAGLLCAGAMAAEPADDYASDLSRVYWGYYQVLAQKEACDTAVPGMRAANDKALAAWQAQHRTLAQELQRRVTTMIRAASQDEKEYARNLGKYEGAILQERQEYRDSPAVNFGRILRGYELSSGNNARLVVAGQRRRGGRTEIEQASWFGGVSPLGPPGGDPQDAGWCGHAWSGWSSLTDAATHIKPDVRGLYRVRDPARPELVYVGEGYIRAPLTSHLGKGDKSTHRQSPYFGAAGLHCRWSTGAWLRHQRLELETDLIGAHVLSTGHAPTAQFLG